MDRTDFRQELVLNVHCCKSILNFFNLKGKLVMFRKFPSSLVITVLVVFFSLFFARVGMSGSMPEEGDAVYRDINTDRKAIKLAGHAGMAIGNLEVIHMQYPEIERTTLTNFYVDYWGSFYAGNSKAAENRVKEAKVLLLKHVKYSLTYYKSFGGEKACCGRCDGLIEWCYEKAGNDIVANDSIWHKISPQLQWKSSKITKRYSTARGKTAYNSALVGIDSTLEKLL